MYENNNVTYKVGINWKDILIKIIMLALFIILLLWLFPRPNLDVFYDTVYNNNINAMKDAARDYYTVDRLPKNVGEQSSMTLKEMFDNHLLIRFTDKDGKTCDETASKVTVSKISENEYALKVQLNCGEQADYILDTIGCTSVCTNGSCQTVIVDKDEDNSNSDNTIADNNNNSNNVDDNIDDELFVNKVTYYQHKKPITTTKIVYTCPDGYTKNGTKCIKETTGATIDATPVYNPDETVIVDAKYTTIGEREYVNPVKTKVGTDYTCPKGYTLNGSYCIKYTDAVEHTTPGTYTCPDKNYELVGKKCIYTYDATYTSGKINYICPKGGDLDGTKCILTIDATVKTDYVCPSGYTPNGASCYKVYNATAKTDYVCPSGYTPNGNKCIKTYPATTKTTYTCAYGGDPDSNHNCSYKATIKSSYTCPKGGSSDNKGNCIYKATAKTTYTCPNGGSPDSNGNCYYTGTAKVDYGNWVVQWVKYYTTAQDVFTHETEKLEFNGAVSGAVCGEPCGNKGIWYKYTYYTRTVKTTYTCPKGGTPNSSGMCYYKGTPNTKYTCAYGGDPDSNHNCSYKATTNSSYTCPKGGSSDNKGNCIYKATTKTDKVCTQGGDLNGQTCKIIIDGTPKTSYICPNGGDLNGTKCVLTATAVIKTEYVCPKGYEPNGKKCVYTYDATIVVGKGNYICPKGGDLSGTKCVITKDATYTPGATTYTCPDGYTLNGKQCIHTISATATDIYDYVCPDGYETEGSGENTKCYVVSTVNKYYCEDTSATLNGTKCISTIKGSISHYTCPSDYSVNGDKCIKQSIITIDAIENVEQTTSYKYTWSKSSYLEGWIFTGKTKVVTENYVAGQK